MAHAGRDHLEPDEKQALKRLVEKELLKVQVDEAGAREERLDLAKKAKRPPTPMSGPVRKRFRFNSESEPSSAASSPDCFGPQAKNGMATVEVSPAEGERPKQASEKAVEESNDEEEQQRGLTARTGLEKLAAKESSEEEEEGSARTSKVSKEESSEEEEEEEEDEDDEDDEDEEEDGDEVPVPSFGEAMAYFAMVKRYLTSFPIDDRVQSHILHLEHDLVHVTRKNHARQAGVRGLGHQS